MILIKAEGLNAQLSPVVDDGAATDRSWCSLGLHHFLWCWPMCSLERLSVGAHGTGMYVLSRGHSTWWWHLHAFIFPVLVLGHKTPGVHLHTLLWGHYQVMVPGTDSKVAASKAHVWALWTLIPASHVSFKVQCLLGLHRLYVARNPLWGVKRAEVLGSKSTHAKNILNTYGAPRIWTCDILGSNSKSWCSSLCPWASFSVWCSVKVVLEVTWTLQNAGGEVGKELS